MLCDYGPVRWPAPAGVDVPSCLLLLSECTALTALRTVGPPSEGNLARLVPRARAPCPSHAHASMVMSNVRVPCMHACSGPSILRPSSFPASFFHPPTHRRADGRLPTRRWHPNDSLKKSRFSGEKSPPRFLLVPSPRRVTIGNRPLAGRLLCDKIRWRCAAGKCNELRCVASTLNATFCEPSSGSSACCVQHTLRTPLVDEARQKQPVGKQQRCCEPSVSACCLLVCWSDVTPVENQGCDRDQRRHCSKRQRQSSSVRTSVREEAVSRQRLQRQRKAALPCRPAGNSWRVGGGAADLAATVDAPSFAVI
jgi:hypothetical protein